MNEPWYELWDDEAGAVVATGGTRVRPIVRVLYVPAMGVHSAFVCLGPSVHGHGRSPFGRPFGYSLSLSVSLSLFSLSLSLSRALSLSLSLALCSLL